MPTALKILTVAGSVIFAAGIAWANFGSYDSRISALEGKQDRQQKVITRMDYNVQIIARALHIKPLERSAGE